MAISLFPHNETAYDAVLAMLAETGKACVIHPTGTGKSFIGFKYCEDHPEQSALWLSPSAYIFKTQCENLLTTGAKMPGSISFMTYAKLSQLTSEELGELKPEVIVLDEMHRAAAPTWEQPVQTLLSREPSPLVIGLTATNIRYLDGQKDTAVTFDMGIASQMTLGEAIARGILNMSCYVLTSSCLEAGLKQYQSRVSRANNAAVRAKGEKLLEALRRALDKADGLDAVFEKHIAERDVHYKPLPMMTAYKALGWDIKDFPNAYDYYRNLITLPLHTKLSDEDVEYVIEQFKEVVKEYI